MSIPVLLALHFPFVHLPFLEEPEHFASIGGRCPDRGGRLLPPRPARSRRREGESAEPNCQRASDRITTLFVVTIQSYSR
jgi:hypothetical protein